MLNNYRKSRAANLTQQVGEVPVVRRDRHVYADVLTVRTFPSPKYKPALCNTAVPPFLQGIPSKTPRGCLKPCIVPNPIYAVYLYTHTYSKVNFMN